MTPELQKILTEQFIGKEIELMIRERDNYGKELSNKYIPVRGICKFIGENEFLNISLQVNIDRTPFRIDHINHVKLIEKKPAIFNDKNKSKSEPKTTQVEPKK